MKVTFAPEFWESYDKLFSNKLYYIIPRFFRNRIHKFKNFWHRMRYDIGCCDLYNYDSYICEKIAKDLKIFKEKTNSYPMLKEISTFEDWKDLIQKIIDGLEAGKRIDFDAEDWIKQEKKAMKEQQEAMKLFAKHIHDFWI